MKNETIALDFPFNSKLDNREIKELTMRRASVGDQLAAEHNSKNQAETEVRLFANLCGVTPDEIKQMDLKDYRKLGETFKSFLA
jgi:hypothetical protein